MRVRCPYPTNIILQFYPEMDAEEAYDFAMKHYRTLRESLRRLPEETQRVAEGVFQLCTKDFGEEAVNKAVHEWKQAFYELDAMTAPGAGAISNEELGELFGHAWSFAHAACLAGK